MASEATLLPRRRDAATHWLLFALALFSGLQIGGALFDSIVNDPLWSASTDAARNWQEVDPSRFYIVFSNLLFLLAIATLIAGWRSPPPMRIWLRGATLLFIVAIVVTFIYFLPEIQQIRGSAAEPIPDDELMHRIERWILLDHAREALILAGFAATLHALGLSYRARAEFGPIKNRITS